MTNTETQIRPLMEDFQAATDPIAKARLRQRTRVLLAALLVEPGEGSDTCPGAA